MNINHKTKLAQNELQEGFSLVELMISLITISLISAAFAPVITKKLSSGAITVGSSGGGGVTETNLAPTSQKDCNSVGSQLVYVETDEAQHTGICVTQYNIGDGNFQIPTGSIDENIPAGENRADGYCSNKKCCWSGQTSSDCNSSNGSYSGCNRTVCNYDAAKSICENLSYGGYSNWRLPNPKEAEYFEKYSKELKNNGLMLCSRNGTGLSTCKISEKCYGGNTFAAYTTTLCHPNDVWLNNVQYLFVGNNTSNVNTQEQYKHHKLSTRCVLGAITVKTSADSCASGTYMNEDSVCTTCPLNATCQGGNKSFVCDQYFERQDKKCKRIACPSGEYLSDETCLKCPVNATCDGVNATCNSGYTLNNNTCTVAHQKPICEEQAVCSFSGDISGDWILTIKASTRVAFTSEEEVDVFAVGGGGAGAGRGNGTGGCGGYTKTIKNTILSGSYVATIGAGGKGGGDWSGGGAGGTTSLGNIISAAGGGGGVAQVQQLKHSCKGGSGGGGWYYDGYSCNGVGGSNGGNGCGPFAGTGQGTTTRAFGENTTDLYAGGGGSENGVSGGAGGGGSTSKNGTPNTGGGGGAYGADGGSGVILIRNARWKV